MSYACLATKVINLRVQKRLPSTHFAIIGTSNSPQGPCAFHSFKSCPQLKHEFLTLDQLCFICRPSDSAVSKDAGIEPMTVATLALAVRRSNHSPRSQSHPQTRLDLIQFSASTFTMNFTSHSKTLTNVPTNFG